VLDVNRFEVVLEARWSGLDVESADGGGAVECQYTPWAQWADACSHTMPKQPRERRSNKSTAAVAHQASNNYLETHFTAAILLPPQVFLPEPSSVGLDLISLSRLLCLLQTSLPLRSCTPIVASRIKLFFCELIEGSC
jgi:hypothetical protein